MSAPLSPPTRLRRVFATLAVAHVALVFTGVGFESPPFLGDSRRAPEADLVTSSMPTAISTVACRTT